MVKACCGGLGVYIQLVGLGGCCNGSGVVGPGGSMALTFLLSNYDRLAD